MQLIVKLGPKMVYAIWDHCSSKKGTEIIRGLSGLRYEDRLHVLQLPTLRYRQPRGDMISMLLRSIM